MVFECSDGAFGGIAPVNVGRYELELYVVAVEVRFEALGCFVVHKVQLWLEAPGFEILMYGLEFGFEFAASARLERPDQDCIAVIIVEYHEILVSFRGHDWEFSGLVGIRFRGSGERLD